MSSKPQMRKSRYNSKGEYEYALSGIAVVILFNTIRGFKGLAVGEAL